MVIRQAREPPAQLANSDISTTALSAHAGLRLIKQTPSPRKHRQCLVIATVAQGSAPPHMCPHFLPALHILRCKRETIHTHTHTHTHTHSLSLSLSHSLSLSFN